MDTELTIEVLEATNLVDAALLGAHIIKVKLPSDKLELKEARVVYEKEKIPSNTLGERVAHIKQATFAGRRLVIFSGGGTKSTSELMDEIKSIAKGGGDGSIIGRNVFQRPRAEALDMLKDIVQIYKEAK